MKIARIFMVFVVFLLATSLTGCGGEDSGIESDLTVSDNQSDLTVSDNQSDLTVSDNQSDLTVSDNQSDLTVSDNQLAAGDYLGPAIVNPSWEEIPDSRLDSVAYDWSPNPTPGYFGGASYPAAGYFAWSGGALDTSRNRLLIYGGGHSDYGGQEIYAFDIETLTWALVAEPEDYAALDAEGCAYGLRTENNFPKSQHSYDKIAYIESIDSLCDTSGSVGYKNCYGGPELACYSFQTQQWSFAPAAVGSSTSAGAIDPATGNWWIVGGNGHLGLYDVINESWIRGDYDNLMALRVNKTAVVDSGNNLFVLAHSGYNGQGYGLYVYPLDRGAPTGVMSNYKITTTGTPPDYRDMGFAYDPVSGQIVAWDGGQKIYLLNTETWEWTNLTATGLPPENPNPTGTFGRFQYIASIDKFILVNSVYENVFFLSLRND